MQGKEAIAAYLATFPTLFNQMKLYSLDIKVGGQEAGVKWRLRFTTKTGNVFFLEGIGHFKFNQDGKIQTEKEFFDLAYFLEQLQKLTCCNRTFKAIHRARPLSRRREMNHDRRKRAALFG